ncbi:hypothetical protein PCASD_06304 [Puccinia coronata f. sp. avenae]|uniref:Zinc finger C2H2 LYAR-type domain-containing protein n=1 Tax=Puccinia coronata f. sp. avenae TaxID=200324 RepID=A0A2N5V8Y2_9BASI|nr:hypothetical protein PCASD_06304 [Puccinia coronata f. sp. avenae]
MPARRKSTRRTVWKRAPAKDQHGFGQLTQHNLGCSESPQQIIKYSDQFASIGICRALVVMGVVMCEWIYHETKQSSLQHDGPELMMTWTGHHLAHSVLKHQETQDSHSMRCRASVTCLDCSTTFNGPASWKPHTTCISEAQKYQKSLYQAPKNKKPQDQHHPQAVSKNNSLVTPVPSVEHPKKTVKSSIPTSKKSSHDLTQAPPTKTKEKVDKKDTTQKLDEPISNADVLPKAIEPVINTSEKVTADAEPALPENKRGKRSKKNKKRQKLNNQTSDLGLTEQKLVEPAITLSETLTTEQLHPKETKQKPSKKDEKHKLNELQTSDLGATDKKLSETDMAASETVTPDPADSKVTKEKRSKKDKKRKLNDAQTSDAALAAQQLVEPTAVTSSEMVTGEPTDPLDTKEKRSKKDKKRKLNGVPTSDLVSADAKLIEPVMTPSETLATAQAAPTAETKAKKSKKDKKRKSHSIEQ